MLIEFYGEECGHCKNLEPLLERLKKELGVQIERVETWHNEANEARRAEYDKGRCGGVPFLVNTDTDAIICGEVEYPDLLAWAGK